MKSIVAVLIFVVATGATKFSDCGSQEATVSKVDVSDCPDSADTCILKKGTTKNLSIEFASKSTSAAVKAVVHGVIGGVPLPFPLPKADGCKSGLDCPLKDGQTYTYSNTLPIRSAYPPLSVTVRWELQDSDGKDIVCVEIPSQIQS